MIFNSYYYLVLCILSICALIYICRKKGNTPTLLLFLAMVQCAYLFETLIYVFLGSYKYHPMIIKYNTFYDSNLGSITSNTLTLPVISVLIAVLGLRWSWMVIFAALLLIIEWLFLKLHIYTHYWWRIEYTALGLIFVYFPLAKILYKRLLHPLKGFLHNLFLFLCISPIMGTLHIIPIMLLSSRYYNPGWFENAGRDTTAFASIYYLLTSLLIVILLNTNWKHKSSKYLLLLVIILSTTITLEKIKILYSLVWWDKLYYLLFPLIVLKIAQRISKKLNHGPLSFYSKNFHN